MPVSFNGVPRNASVVQFEFKSGSTIFGWVSGVDDPPAIAILMLGIRSKRTQITLGHPESYDAQAAVHLMQFLNA